MHSFVDHSPISSPNSSPPQFMEEGSCSPRMNLNLDLHLLKSSNSSPDNGCESPTLAALHRFLPSNNEDSWSPEHLYACDEFRMFEFKVRRCMRGRSHDWTECPFAHPGEKARRRDPRRFHYSGTACPDFRKGSCKSGDACDLAHGVFECWLHPARYRTQPCKDGRNCKRKVCFFAHTPEQLRLPPPASPPMSPMSDTSPPLTPRGAARDAALLRQAAVLAEAQAILRHAHLERMNSMPHVDPDRRSRLLGQSLSFNGRPTSGLLLPEPSVGYSGSYGGSPVSSPYGRSPLFRSSDCGRSIWADSNPYEEQRVESGRDLRAKVYGKIMKENLPECGDCPDLGWVNELVAIN